MKPRGYRKQLPDSECIKSEERTESVCREQLWDVRGWGFMNKRLIESEILVCGGETKLEAVWNVATRHEERSSPVSHQDPSSLSLRNSLAGCFEELRPSAPTCIVVTRKTCCSGTTTPRAEVQPSHSLRASPWTRARRRQFWQIFMLSTVTESQRLARKWLQKNITASPANTGCRRSAAARKKKRCPKGLNSAFIDASK